MERKINLEEILDGVKLENGATFSSYISKDGDIYRIVKIAMKEACRQILELATENAEISWVENDIEMESDTDFSFRDNDGNWCKININEQSILNTIKQIEP